MSEAGVTRFKRKATLTCSNSVFVVVLVSERKKGRKEERKKGRKIERKIEGSKIDK